ncbi:polar amino acid transport system permease protein [Pseudomonas marginalis]|uniref:ABC transporter permease n=1 Tax=Pseudomonas TaxID=286 RepID=UPI00209F1708|nr:MULTISPECIES: ABC transporter permease subunit [Pseudomonas]MCP1505665.1 polar amino acid transport system permease protein [Pseudomonas marginalis]MCP1523169.1 polar amino acid transport system permease protein [Pseudomonas marginalis]MDQ0497513.1 polar amino acid transport system permease protein [Pseudomonas marginalis]
MTAGERFAEWLGLELFQRYGAQLLDGLLLTLQLVALSSSVGMVLGVLLALGRTSRWRSLQYACRAYVYFFRGSPLLAQLFLIYYGLGSFHGFWRDLGLWGWFGDPWFCALLAFTLNTAAYQAEIFRGGLLSVPRAYYEAATVLGLNRTTTFFKVTLPQVLIVTVGPLGNELILIIKASAIVSLVTLLDLMGVAKLAFSRTFDFQVYVWVALVYLVVVECVRRGVKRLDRRLTQHLRPTDE